MPPELCALVISLSEEVFRLAERCRTGRPRNGLWKLPHAGMTIVAAAGAGRPALLIRRSWLTQGFIGCYRNATF